MNSAFRIVAMSLLLGVSAQAEEVQVGRGVFCDTRDQAQRFVALFDGDAATALRTVNAEEHNATACGVATVAYLRSRNAGTIRSKTNAFEIVQVVIVGVNTPAGIRMMQPAVSFLISKIEEYAA
jgi:hypothetical protein